MTMNLLTTEYSLSHKALEVYVAGCRWPHCPGCHNPESWDFQKGSPWTTWKPGLKDKLTTFGSLIDEVWVLGGEPLDQERHELIAMLKWLKSYRPVMLWTKYGFHEVPGEIFSLCDRIKCGRYRDDLQAVDHVQDGIRLASSNQYII